MPLTLRLWEPEDELFLWEMLYQAIHVVEGDDQPPRSILDGPMIAHHLAGFGAREGDDAVIGCDGSLFTRCQHSTAALSITSRHRSCSPKSATGA